MNPASPLRILVTNSARKWIGEAAHALALCEALASAGHEVWLAVRAGSELHYRGKDQKVRLLPLHFNSRFHILKDWQDLRRIRRFVRAHKIDLVHCHRGKDHWLAAGALRFLRPPVPLVRTRHVVTPVRSHFFNRMLYSRWTQGVVSVSKAAQDSFGGMLQRFPPHASRVIYSPVNSALFCPGRRSNDIRENHGLSSHSLWIGLIGRIQRVKGQRYFLEMAAKVARERPQAFFLVAGRGNARQVAELRSRARELGIPDERLSIEGVLPNLPEVMASLDIGVIASTGSEGSSRVCLEYMASGLPVVATSVGGIPELMKPGNFGRMVPPRNSELLADAVRSLVDRSDYREAAGAAGRARVVAAHNVEQWAEAIVDFYRQML